jgi:hypothetical protein
MLEDLPYSHQPDKRFKESQHSGRPTSSSKHVNDSNRIDGYIADPGYEYQ